MNDPLHILIVEDNASDRELMEHELRKSNVVFTSKCVEEKESFQRELKDFSPDVILCDFKLPSFGAVAALEIALKISPLTPFIIVTGSVSEEVAVECIKAGAADYIIKDRLTRLTSAVTNALEKRKIDEERYSAIQALRTSEQRYRAIFDISPEVIVVVDKNGKIIDINQSVADYTGYQPAEMIGLSMMEPNVFSPHSKVIIGMNFIKILRGESVAPYEVDVIKKTGEKLITRLYTNVLKGPGGELSGIIAVFFDVTEQKDHEEKLRKERDKARMYFEAAGTIFVVIDSDQTLSLINSMGCRILGYEKEEITGRNWFDNFLPARHRDEVKSVFRNLLAGHIGPFERIKGTILTKSGEERIIMWNNVLLKDEKGKVYGTLSSGDDITEMENAAADLKRTLSSLKDFKDLTVGRENRMIELKREINKLSSELGRPKPYDISFSE